MPGKPRYASARRAGKGKPDVSAGLVGKKLEARPRRDSVPPTPRPRKARYACICRVSVQHGSFSPCLVLWEGSDVLEKVSRVDAEGASLLLDLLVVEPNPWRALSEEDIADIWRLAPPGSMLRPIHAGQAASLLVECPDGSFSQIAASPILANIPGAMRLAYGDGAPAGTWTLKPPFHLT